MEGYKAKVIDSKRVLTAREKVMMKDTTEAIKLDEATQETGAIIITPVNHAVILIHNEHSENTDYEVYVLVDKDGQKYVTGSESFWSTYTEIYEEMLDAEEEDYSIKVYRRPSKKYAGKEFLTCSLV